LSAPEFPFSALVGQDDLRVALLANAVNPAIGGVLVRGEKGTAKSTAVRSLVRLLPEVEVVAGCPYACEPDAPDPECPAGPHPPEGPAQRRPARLVELPVGASTDRVAGSLDLERALVDGVRAFEPGLLAAAHRGVLYVDEVNLLPDHLVDLLLDAAALGVNYVEREGVSVRHAARFVLVGTMNPEEGEVRPQLLDRFGISVEVRGSRDPDQRAEVVRRRLAFEADPESFASRFAADDRRLGERVRAARARLPRVRCPDPVIGRIAGACAALDVDGLRADIVATKTAAVLAALDGAAEVGDDHVRRAARLALAHRRRRGPLEQPGLEDAQLERALGGRPDDEPPPGADGGAPGPGAAGTGGNANRDGAPASEAPAPATAARAGDGGDDARTPPPRPGERVDAPAGEFTAPLLELAGAGAGAAGRRSRSAAETGRAVGDRPRESGGDLALLPTLRAAAPHQCARGRRGPGLVLRAPDLRAPVREGREGNLVLFVVDASGSMGARRRMRAVKAAVLALLVDAYQRRDRVGLISFRGDGANLLLAPTASVEVGARSLADLPTGGRTPLAAGLARAGEVIRFERLREPHRRPLVLLVTDGRTNAPAPDPAAAARRAAAQLTRAGVGLVVVDTEEGSARLGLAAALAAAAGAPRLGLDALAGDRVTGLVRYTGRRAA
jgi:magnesium chelatase subunit D